MTNDILYKYLDINGALCTIRNKELQFTNATKLNDPFDCHQDLIDFSNPPEGHRGWMPKEWITEMDEINHKNYRDSLWISSLTRNNTNLLMWAHYAKHNGVCIGFHKNNLVQKIDAYYFGMGQFIGDVEVKYRPIGEKPDYYRSSIDPDVYLLETKDQKWSYEEEVRLAIYRPHWGFIPMRMNRKTVDGEYIDYKELRVYPNIGSESFESIYLGKDIDPVNKQLILKAIEDSGLPVNVYQMSLDEKKLGLVAIPLLPTPTSSQRTSS